MKKHNEGYALPFVLVVITVMFLVALAISTVSLRNLHTQEAFVQQMQDKYAAQGKIEIFVSQLDSVIDQINLEDLDTFSRNAGITMNRPDPAENATVIGLEDTSITVTLTATEGTSQITCTLLIQSKDKILTNTHPLTYQLTSPTYEYTSYDISTVAEGGGASE